MAVLVGTSLAGLQNATGNYLTKTFTFTGAAGAGAIGPVAVATVAGGAVVIDHVVGRITTTLTGVSATISLGTASQVAGIIAATTATGMTTTANVWASNTPTAGLIAIPAAVSQGFYTVESLIFTIASAAVATGVLELDFIWHPLTSGATLV